MPLPTRLVLPPGYSIDSGCYFTTSLPCSWTRQCRMSFLNLACLHTSCSASQRFARMWFHPVHIITGMVMVRSHCQCQSWHIHETMPSLWLHFSVVTSYAQDLESQSSQWCISSLKKLGRVQPLGSPTSRVYATSVCLQERCSLDLMWLTGQSDRSSNRDNRAQSGGSHVWRRPWDLHRCAA